MLFPRKLKFKNALIEILSMQADQPIKGIVIRKRKKTEEKYIKKLVKKSPKIKDNSHLNT